MTFNRPTAVGSQRLLWVGCVLRDRRHSTHCCRWRQAAIERLHSSRYLEASRKRWRPWPHNPNPNPNPVITEWLILPEVGVIGFLRSACMTSAAI